VLAYQSRANWSIDVTNFPNKRFDAASTAINLVESDLTDNLAAMLPVARQRCAAEAPDGMRLLAELLDLLNLARKLCGEGLLQRLQLTLLN
jgi:hypothetical protein